METRDIAILNTSQVRALTTAAVSALTTDQIQALTTADIAMLHTEQVLALTTDQVVALTTAQIHAITAGGIAALTTDQVAALETSDIAILTSVQAVALTTAQVATLRTDQVLALGTSNVQSLSTDQITALTTDAISVLATTQIAALGTFQIEALTSSQVAVLTTVQIPHLRVSTPVILDLNGDGVQTLSITSGVRFDMFANGLATPTGWVSSGDGLLVMDRNQDGRINDGSELFGSATTLANGRQALDGYAALRELDGNQDGVIDHDDVAFSELRVWVDSNSSGTTEEGELHTLESLQITKIATQATVAISENHDNVVGLTSTYETADGNTHAAADVWFLADTSQSSNTLASDPLPTIPPASAANLSSRVSSLAQTIGAFSRDDALRQSTDTSSTPTAMATAKSTLASSATLVSMVDAMQRFDADGKAVSPLASPVATLGGSKTLPGLPDTGTGVLASPA